MGQRGPEGVLNESKPQAIVVMLSVGGIQSQAARHFGCARSTISNTAERDPDFARRLGQFGNPAYAKIKTKKEVRTPTRRPVF